MDIINTLNLLCSKAGVSGCEYPASEAVAEMLKEYADNVYIDPFGNVTGTVLCGKNGAKKLMLDAHIDRIGMIVTYITDKGFVKVGACGGLDPRVLLGQSVTIHGYKEDISGVVANLPPHVSGNSRKSLEVTDLSIDIGMTKKNALNYIKQGDVITVKSEFRQLSDNRISASAIDDRSGVCAILLALDMIKNRELSYDLEICFSAQEETGERGAKQTAFRVQPDECIAVDVSFGTTPDSVAHETAPLGSGVMIGYSAALDKQMSNELCKISEEKNIPHTIEVMPSSTGTNADSIAISGKGVRCCTLSIPIRYMHTPVETVDISDIIATSQLICEYACGGLKNA